MRIGILTGGGDCSSLNAAIRGVAKSLILNQSAEIVGIEDGILGMIEKRVRPLQTQDFNGLIHEGGTLLGSCNRASPANYQGRDVRRQVAQYYRELQLDCIVALGGDGTMSMCHDLAGLGMNFVGIPKTIDNDLMHTDRTFGFDTAVSIVTEAIDRLQTTGRSHHRVMIVETMGRYAGWVALYGGVAGDADIILIPEFPYHIEEVLAVIEARVKQHSHSIIVVAEGAMPIHGSVKIGKTVEGSPDPIRLGGVGQFLQEQIESRCTAEVRTTVLGHIQRGGPPTAFDRIFATNLGCFAAHLVATRQFGRMVCVKDNQLQTVSIADVANQTRTVTSDDMTLLSALGSGVSFGVPDLQSRITLKKSDHPHLR